MDDPKIKRGIDFGNRLWQSGLETKLRKTFSWWHGEKLGITTFVFLFLISIINLFIVFPILKRDISFSFSHSSSLLRIANFVDGSGTIDKRLIFQFIAIIIITFSPISFYLFVRRMALRYELIALFSVLFFIIPNPISPDGLPLIDALTAGDGAHAFALTFIPLLLVYIQTFISTGVSTWMVISAISIAVVAIISPFAMFNLLIFITIITIAEGFLGELRIKIFRMLFLLTTSFALSLFWYHPSVIIKIMQIVHVNYALQKFWQIFPIAIPIIPIFGTISFLVFDKREKLKPIFVASSFFIIYLFLITISKTLNVTGIFTSDRYLIEFSFAKSFLAALFIVIVGEIIVRRYILQAKRALSFFIAVFVLVFVSSYVIVVSIVNIRHLQIDLSTRPFVNDYSISGLGKMVRIFNLTDISFVLASIISLTTFVFLILILVKFKPVLKHVGRRENEK